jgi:hypothetical protein
MTAQALAARIAELLRKHGSAESTVAVDGTLTNVLVDGWFDLEAVARDLQMKVQ